MRRIALILVALMISAPVLTAQQTSPRFEVASVKPNTGADLGITFGPTPAEGINLINRPLESVVRYAFGVQPFRLLGLPAWTFDERFDINARASQAISDDDRKAMLRSLLTDRFGLKAHFEKRDQPVYVLTRVRTDAPGLKPRPDCAVWRLATEAAARIRQPVG
jgi:uncharacterized protein (TIGR03435 family)